MIKIDEDNLQQVADMLAILNPAHANPDWMRAHALANITQGVGRYVATGGWIAFTWFDPHTFETKMRFAIEPFTIKYALEKGLIATPEEEMST
jgi:hypothetical protein